MKLVSRLLIVFGILIFIVAMLFTYASKHTLDGSASLYHLQHRYFLIGVIISAVFLLTGVVLGRKH